MSLRVCKVAQRDTISQAATSDTIKGRWPVFHRAFCQVVYQMQTCQMQTCQMQTCQMQTFPQTAFEGSVVNALRHPESCVLPVRLSAQMFVHNLGSGGPVSALRVAPAIAGSGGRCDGFLSSSLSVLWQVRLGQDRANEENVSRSEIMAIADYLYTQWAGIHLASES